MRLTVRERHRLERRLLCQNCESSIDALDKVAAYSPRQLVEIRRHQKWAKRFARDMRAFEKLLAAYPSLGGFHKMGAELARGIKTLTPTTLHPERWYRARGWKEDETLVTKDMLPSDPHEVFRPPGRFNHAGQIGLYTAKFPADAAVELLDDPRQPTKVWMAEIEFEEPLRVLDLGIWIIGEQSGLPIVLEGLRGALTEPRERADWAPREYHVARFVADLVRKRGLDGIVYTSSREHPFGPDVYGKNLVVVNYRKAKIVWGPTLHEWKNVPNGPPFNLPRMDFEPAIPTEWWERLRQRGNEPGANPATSAT